MEAEFNTNLANIKSEAQTKEESHDETIARINSEAEKKSNAFDKQITQLKTEFAEKEEAYTEQIANIKAEAEQTIKERKQTEIQLKKQIAELKEENEKKEILTNIFKENVTIQKPELMKTGKQLQRKITSCKKAQESPDQLRMRLNKLLVNVSKLNREYKLACSKTKTKNQQV